MLNVHLNYGENSEYVVKNQRRIKTVSDAMKTVTNRDKHHGKHNCFYTVEFFFLNRERRSHIIIKEIKPNIMETIISNI